MAFVGPGCPPLAWPFASVHQGVIVYFTATAQSWLPCASASHCSVTVSSFTCCLNICWMSQPCPTSNRVLAYLLLHGTCSEPCIWLLLLLPQHIPVVGSIFGDSFYDQQLALRQTNALSHQVCEDSRRLEITYVRLSRVHTELCFCFS